MENPKRVELRNSMWCVDKDGNLGMIAEINGGIATFYREAKVADGEAPRLESDAHQVPLDQLALCAASQVPARAALSQEQLAEYPTG